MASIKLKGDTSGEITIQAPAVAGTTTLNLPATSSTLATQNALGVRNLIINGDMKIDQRNGGASVTLDNSNQYAVDRFISRENTDGTATAQQVTDVPVGQGFINSLKITVGTADTSLASTQYLILAEHRVEGLNASHLDWGTANPKTVTLSFWVKSSLTGTFGGSFRNGGSALGYAFEYNINTADTWEKKTINIEGHTSGTFNTDINQAFNIIFSGGGGSNMTQPAGSWVVANVLGATGQVELIGTSGATWQITGVQLEVGDTATPFEHRPYDMELARCQRYYYKRQPTGSVATLQPQLCFGGYSSSTTLAVYFVDFPVPMRIAPTAMEQSGTASDYGVKGTGSTLTLSSVPAWSDTTSFYLGAFTGTVSSGLTAGQSLTLRAMSSNTYLAWSAEL